jgi:class 3 adenylate cyclase
MSEEPPGGLVTVLFTDIVGSAALKTSQDDVAAQEIVRAHLDLLREQVKAHRGRAIKSLGDGLMPTFVSPAAPLPCAIDMQPAPADGNRERPPEQQPCSCRWETFPKIKNGRTAPASNCEYVVLH